jgi:hypothetical protein
MPESKKQSLRHLIFLGSFQPGASAGCARHLSLACYADALREGGSLVIDVPGILAFACLLPCGAANLRPELQKPVRRNEQN